MGFVGIKIAVELLTDEIIDGSIISGFIVESGGLPEGAKFYDVWVDGQNLVVCFDHPDIEVGSCDGRNPEIFNPIMRVTECVKCKESIQNPFHSKFYEPIKEMVKDHLKHWPELGSLFLCVSNNGNKPAALIKEALLINMDDWVGAITPFHIRTWIEEKNIHGTIHEITRDLIYAYEGVMANLLLNATSRIQRRMGITNDEK